MTRTHRVILSDLAPENATAHAGSLEDYLEGSRGSELEAARRQAHTEGYTDALTGAAASLEAAAETLESSREECLSEVTRVAVELGLGIARRLVTRRAPLRLAKA